MTMPVWSVDPLSTTISSSPASKRWRARCPRHSSSSAARLYVATMTLTVGLIGLPGRTSRGRRAGGSLPTERAAIQRREPGAECVVQVVVVDEIARAIDRSHLVPLPDARCPHTLGKRAFDRLKT